MTKNIGSATLLTFTLLLRLHAQGQSSPPSISPLDGTTPGLNTPGSPVGAYRMSNIETVSLSNGHLNIAIPLAPTLGRGAAAITPTLRIESRWMVRNVPVYYNCVNGQCAIGTSYVIQNLPRDFDEPTYAQGLMMTRPSGDFCSAYQFSCNTNTTGACTYYKWDNTLTRAAFTAPDGTEYEFRDQLSGGSKQAGQFSGGPSISSPPPPYNRGGAFIAYDGSGATFNTAPILDPTDCRNTPSLAGGTLVLRDGTRYQISGGYVTQIEDRNGNQLNLSSSDIVDALGRRTTYAHPTAAADGYAQYPGAGGIPRTTTIKQDYLHNRLLNGCCLQTTSQLFPDIPACVPTAAGCSPSSTPYDPNDVIASVTLPNGQSFQFWYNAYGDVAEIDLPTGGKYTYTYGTYLGVGSAGNSANSYTIARYITEKDIYLNVNDTTPVQKIQYSGTFTSNPVTVTYLDGNNNMLGKEAHSLVGVNLSPNSDGTVYNGWQSGKETQIQYYDSDGTTLLKTETTAWHQRDCSTESTCWFLSAYGLEGAGAPSHDPRPTQKTVTSGSVMSEQDYSYDNYNNETDRSEYGYRAAGSQGPGTLIRRAHTDYVTDPSYTSAYHLISLVSAEKIYDSSNTTVIAETDYAYDQYQYNFTPLSDAPGITMHDSNYGTGFTTRGNPTTVTRIWNDSVHGLSNIALQTKFTYDIAGNIVETVDPRLVRRDYSYCDSGAASCSGGTYALPTSVTSYPTISQTSPPVPTSPAFTARIQYDYNTGKPISTTDINSNITTYGYNDLLDRLKQITRPDGSHTTYNYNDTPGQLSTAVTMDQTSINDNALQVQTIYFDNLGRKTQSISGGVSVCYGYDGRGRLNSVSNPGCGNTVTITAFDGINRPISITQPGTAVTTKSYNANQTLERDPAGVTKLYTDDALGRLSSVVENPTSWNGGNGIGNPSLSTYTTAYAYDAIDDLTGVTQGSQTRTFAYDSLKRLVRSQNPESGTITYFYDNSGNIQS